jgi:hypothetical protein
MRTWKTDGVLRCSQSRDSVGLGAEIRPSPFLGPIATARFSLSLRASACSPRRRSDV